MGLKCLLFGHRMAAPLWHMTAEVETLVTHCIRCGHILNLQTVTLGERDAQVQEILKARGRSEERTVKPAAVVNALAESKLFHNTDWD